MQKNKTKPKAFTLLELSIVLILVGGIIIGVLQGANLIGTGRLANARALTSRSNINNINGLTLWYETSLKNSFNESQAYNNSQLTEWYDVSPFSIVNKTNKLTKSAGADVVYTRSGINQLPSVSFNGSGKISLASLAQGTFSQATIFIVFRPNYTTTSSFITLFDAGPSQPQFRVSISNDRVRLDAGVSGSSNSVTNSFINNYDYALAVYINGTSSSAYLNDVTTLFGGVKFNSGTNSINGLTIGSNLSSTENFNGLISEIIVFNRALKINERREVFSYLSKKYKISIKNI